MKAFLAGLGIGAGLGVCFAPKRGSEVRADIEKAIRNLVGNGSERRAHRTSDRRDRTRDDDAGRGDHGLNTATKEQLMSVYGIGSVLADRIILNRPYAKAHDVVEKGIISENTFAQLRKDLLLGNKAD
jgi:hypothetical protein